MRSFRRALRSSLVLALIGGIALGACGGGAANTSSTSSTSSTSTTTSTTTTTLPVPMSLSGSTPTGPYTTLGPISRIVVEPIAEGASAPAVGPAAQASAVQIGYRRFGSGPDLLMIMGEHGTMTWWDPQLLSDLAAHFTVTIFDLPDVGYSSPLTGAYTLGNLSDVTAGLCYALGLKSPVVLGWGLGGAIALESALRHEKVYSRLILVEPTTPLSGAKPQAPVSARLSSAEATTVALSRLLFPTSVDSARLGWLARIDAVPPDVIIADAIAEEARLVSSLGRRSIPDSALRAFRMPTTVVIGTEDEVVPPVDGDLLSRALGKATLVTYADAGYGALFQDEKAFSALVEKKSN